MVEKFNIDKGVPNYSLYINRYVIEYKQFTSAECQFPYVTSVFLYYTRSETVTTFMFTHLKKPVTQVFHILPQYHQSKQLFVSLCFLLLGQISYKCTVLCLQIEEPSVLIQHAGKCIFCNL